MKNLLITAQKNAKGVFVATGAVMASSATYALDTTDITAAMASGNTAVTTTAAGLIALVAIVVGVGMVISLMKRS